MRKCLVGENGLIAWHGSKPSPRLAWDELVVFYESLHSLSDEEEAWVGKLLDQWEAAEKDKAAELDSAQAQDQRDVLGEASAEKETMTGDAMLTPDVIQRSDVSQRGRKRTTKWFGDEFGQFDDDC